MADVHRYDALNLTQYVALRHRDNRALQRRLADRGLSSLGRCEPHVWATLRAVLEAIGVNSEVAGMSGPSFKSGRLALDSNTDSLFGPRPAGRVTRIMVTLPSEAATDVALVVELARRGMDVARINGAHDTPAEWAAMTANVARAATKTGRQVLVEFDLPGPKLRTGPIEAGPRVRRFRPERDRRGRPVTPARFSLHHDGPNRNEEDVPVAGDSLDGLSPGDQIFLRDARGAARHLRVTGTGPGRVEVEAWDTTYLETGLTLDSGHRRVKVAELPAVEQYHVLRPGDLLDVASAGGSVPPWRPGSEGTARIGCTLPDAVTAARPGDRVVFDEGRISGVVETTTNDGSGVARFRVRIQSAHPAGSRLRSDKSINLPDTTLPVPMLTTADQRVLEAAARDGDLVGLSFLRHENDLDIVMRRLQELRAGHLGLILKVETVPAFERLPEILLRAMRWPRIGVMIARGDLAVESSYERLAEVQEEILWLAEAAHLPVVWATEVLDQLARTGHPTRAEITDAAMAQRAECVMLNKGPYVDLAITALDDILKRMSGHQRKKVALLRRLRSWYPAD